MSKRRITGALVSVNGQRLIEITADDNWDWKQVEVNLPGGPARIMLTTTSETDDE